MPKSEHDHPVPAIDAERLKLMRDRARIGRAEFASKSGPAQLANTDGGIAAFQDVLHDCIAQLKAARERAGLSLDELALVTDLSPESLARLEAGETMNPTWKTLGRIAVAVGCRLKLAAEPE